MSILIKNALIVTQNHKREILQGDVYIEDELISEIGNVHIEADTVIEGKNIVVMPGLINTHTHVAMTGMRGIADDVDLFEFLQKVWAVEEKMTWDDIYKGARMGIEEMLRTGTTTFVDMYSYEDAVAKAVKELGIRGYLGWAVVNEEITTQGGTPVKNAEEFIRTYRGDDLVTPMIAPHAVYTCDEETLLSAKDVAERYETLMTIHIAETRKEVYDHRKKTGMRPVEWLDKIGFLKEGIIAAHLVWLTLREIKILAEHNVVASHNPTSNMKLGNGGSMPLPEMLNESMNITLGTDSVVSNNNLDMFETMKIAAILHKNERWDPRITNAQMILDFATINAARALGLNAGSIEEGKLADVIVVDGDAPNARPMRRDNVVSNIVYSLNGLNVKYTIVNGKIVYGKDQE